MSMRMGFVLSLALMGSGAPALAAQELPEVDQHGLHLVHDSEVRVAYARPGVDFAQFDKVILVDAYVAFRKDWQRDANRGDPMRVNSNDVEQIKQRVAERFHEVFTKTLEDRGFPVVPKDQVGPDVLIVRPAIIDLDIVAPDTMETGLGTNRVYARSAGSMTLYAELYDSQSSQLIAEVIDPQRDRGMGGMGMQINPATNRRAFNQIVERWAELLADRLGETIRPE